MMCIQLTRSWHGIGSIELRINRHIRGANDLQRGRIIFPHNQLHKGYVIRHREIELDENGKITENWIIRALPLKSWLGQRLTYPPSHTGYDNRQGDAETVMRHYVNNNVVNPTDTDRTMPDIVLADNLNRGINVSWQSRYKNLAEELQIEYEKDYDLGDVVTLQNKDWGITMDARITEAKEIYEPGGRKIELVFGNDRPTLIDIIKQELSVMKTEITR